MFIPSHKVQPGSLKTIKAETADPERSRKAISSHRFLESKWRPCFVF